VPLGGCWAGPVERGPVERGPESDPGLPTNPGVLPRAGLSTFDPSGLHALARARTGRLCSLQAQWGR